MAKIDFKLVASAALNSLESLLNRWLPGGKRDGHEYKALNPTRGDSKPGSFSINLNTGAWADFATDDKGGDAISLYAYIHGLEQLEAAREVMEQIGMRADEPVSHRKHVEASPAPAKSRSEWVPVVPVPGNAPTAPVAHIKRGKPDSMWAYRTAEGGLVGYICRFTTSDGGKEILPLTFCQHGTTGAQEWRWMAFPEPRALYVPTEWRDELVKLVVEGEKCADAALNLLPEYVAVTWPGGSKAVDKVDWSRFKDGDKVLLWPDCDAQTGKDGELLPEAKQPGVAAMEKVAQHLIGRGCKVRIVAIPAPGEKPSGWDIADAVQDGMSADDVRAFIKANQRAPAVAEKSILPASRATAGEWDAHLFMKNGAIRECRENVFQILHHHPEWSGALWRDEFSNRIILRRDVPIGKKAGEEWCEEDDFKLGLWLAQNLRLFIKANVMLADGIRAEAEENKFHPVRDYLDALKWDGTTRLGEWLTECAGVDYTPYTALVARYFLIGMVARIYRPGCKMDVALILEGLQGAGKSTVAKVLALNENWFSDTVFMMGDKDSFQALRGRWVYELSELDSFGKAESTRAKAFISSSTDSYRAPYDRTFKDHPRQCVFVGTTNQYEYFKDSSGNRRFWPVHSSGAVNIEALTNMRDQLFAEAVQAFKQGDRWYPSKEEQNNLFGPEQEARELADPWMTAISSWLLMHSQVEVTTLEILTGALKVEVSKIDGARQMTTRVGICMRKLGWGKTRKTSGTREYVYTKPKKEDDDASIPF